jgi:glycosyltransferase involved in cell wall biosynthesis
MMKLAMKVSVLMPTFNVAAYVGTAVNSILEQTYRNHELLIQNDGSTDGTIDIVQALARSDSRVRVLGPFPTNRGVVAARNALLEAAQGDFVAWMDSDDLSMPQRLQSQIEFLDRNPEFGAVGTAIQWINAKAAPQSIQKFSQDPARQASNPDICCASVMARRTAVADAGPFRDAFFPGGEDQDWLLRMADRHKVTNIDDVLYAYRRHPGLMERNRVAVDRLIVLARHAARVRRCGEPDPIDALVPDKRFYYLRDEVFLTHLGLDPMDKVQALAQPLPESTPLVSILIPYYDDDIYFFEKSLQHLSRQMFRNFEIVIHDDASKRPVDEVRVRTLVPGIAVTVIRSPAHEGATRAKTTLLDRARGSIVLWQNEEVDLADWMNPDLDGKARRALWLTALVIARLDSTRGANDSCSS